MSLYNRMLNSTATVTVNESAYGHEGGAAQIAMESIQELYTIFRESTYEAEQAEISAVREGVTLEGSEYHAVYESAIKTGIAKVKTFLQSLWAKVKAFFANVVKFLDGIFKSGKDFATKYEKDLLALGAKLDGFEYKMYDYDHAKIDEDASGVADEMDAMIETNKKAVDGLVSSMEGENVPEADREEIIKDMKKKSEEATKKARKKSYGSESEDDQAEGLFKAFRNGAVDESDKKEIKINIKDIIKVLKDSKPDNIKKTQTACDAAYTKAIKYVDGIAAKQDKLEGTTASIVAELVRGLSSDLSKEQAIVNAHISAQKSAFVERSNTYKQVCLAAFRYKKEK